MGVALFGARALQKRPRKKGPGFDSHRNAPVQHILLDIDDGEDAHKDDEEDEDDEMMKIKIKMMIKLRMIKDEDDRGS